MTQTFPHTAVVGQWGSPYSQWFALALDDSQIAPASGRVAGQGGGPVSAAASASDVEASAASDG
jgi:hypothetical protein